MIQLRYGDYAIGLAPYGKSISVERRYRYYVICIHRNYTTLYNCCQGLLSLAPRKWGCNPPMALSATLLIKSYLLIFCSINLLIKL